MLESHPDRPRAFTLIELLVVIAVIALLISILLPALGQARESGRSIRCMANMKQIGTSLSNYALDYKGRVWESGWNSPYRFWYAQPQNPLQTLTGANPAVAGPALGYLGDVDKVFECPSNKRRTPGTDVASMSDPFWSTPSGLLQQELFKLFLSPRALNFDYTMLTGATGARVDSPVQVMWDTRCQNMTGGQTRTQPTLATLKPLRALPAFIEEDSIWFNANNPDGMWSNRDQITGRHGRKSGYMVLTNGDVELTRFPRGPDPASQNDIGDFTANDVWAQGAGGIWYQVAPSWPTPGVKKYGWFDRPR